MRIKKGKKYRTHNGSSVSDVTYLGRVYNGYSYLAYVDGFGYIKYTAFGKWQPDLEDEVTGLDIVEEIVEEEETS